MAVPEAQASATMVREGEPLDTGAAGFYLRTDAEALREGSWVELDVRVPADQKGNTVNLHGLGQIVRVDREEGGGTGMAVAFERIEFWTDDLDSFT